MFQALCDDLAEEYITLDSMVSDLPLTDLVRLTSFFDWSVRDQILHLLQVDRFGLISLRSADAFSETFRTVRAAQAGGIELSTQIRREFADTSNAEVLDAWRTTYRALLELFRASDPKARMKWFGPDMSVVSFVSARQMEVWAHGQDIYDMLGKRREAKDRIRNICELGVRTFGWSFRNRGLNVPPSPAVRLTAPSGVVWTWEGDGHGSVTGSALDFALVVTQRRAPADTVLRSEGESAALWLPIAQCFAGAPQEPALPGSRPEA
jgi:uncharacterized protein (TIGR03084 family)